MRRLCFCFFSFALDKNNVPDTHTHTTERSTVLSFVKLCLLQQFCNYSNCFSNPSVRFFLFRPFFFFLPPFCFCCSSALSFVSWLNKMMTPPSLLCSPCKAFFSLFFFFPQIYLFIPYKPLVEQSKCRLEAHTNRNHVFFLSSLSQAAHSLTKYVLQRCWPDALLIKM